MINTLSFLNNVFPKNDEGKPCYTAFFLSLVLISIPTKYIFISIALILFVAHALRNGILQKKITFQKHLLLPIAFFLWMVLSLFWTKDQALTRAGLQKELPFLLVPMAFLVLPKLSKTLVNQVFRNYSWFMVLYALFFFLRAIFRFITTQDNSVFFYHNLVTEDLNAIYISIFASLALVYFVIQEQKTTAVKSAIIALFTFVVLLSSKSIITIDIILIIGYYAFYAPIPKGVKTTTILSVLAFIIGSFLFVKQVRDRFLIEYETAFVDNTINANIGNGNVYNVSLNQAWNQEKFEQNHFFPGTALRVFQVRIFKEMLEEQPILFTGFGLEASQEQIKAKVNQHGLYGNYGDFNYHNQYIQSFSDLGIIGFIFVLLLVGLNLKNAFLSKDFLHIAFSITMIILFLSESFFCRQRGIVFFIILYCLFQNADMKISRK
ncbi:MAG: hypothetical protein RLZZ500_1878 [Bacteroidota bacterium]|jgi:O-antigen ligase